MKEANRPDESSEPATDASSVDAMVDALLISYHEKTSVQDARISRLIERFAAECAGGDDAGRSENSVSVPERFRVSAFHLGMASLAATTLVGIGIWLLIPPSNVEAAITRAVTVLNEPSTRIYDVEFATQGNANLPSGTATLYRHSSDRFLLRMAGGPLGPLLIGANQERRWVRSGSRVWKSDDQSNDDFPSALRLDRMTFQQIRFNQLLEGLPIHYDLKWLDNESLPHSTEPLVRVEATRRFAAPGLPIRVTLWIDPNTDITRRIEVEMRRDGLTRIQSFVATLREVAPYQESLFEADSHE